MGTQSATRGAVLSSLDAAAARRWAVLTRRAFAARRAEIDGLNVFPVPDGDTGTNLFLTVDGALATTPSASGAPDDLARQSRAFARAVLLTARGNSGVILSQIFRGLADEIESSGAATLGGAGLARALVRADELAWAGVSRPVEGTILSVSRAACRAGAVAGDRLDEVVCAVLSAAREALARTPAQLPALARAGVVDAGGTGYVVLLEALDHVVRGEEAVLTPPAVLGRRAPRSRLGPPLEPPPEPPLELRPSAGHAGGAAPAGATGAAYEVTYLLDDSDDGRVAALRARLDGLGDSVVVAGEGGRWTVHVHVETTPAVGAVIEAGVEAGRPHRVDVTRFADASGPGAPHDGAPSDGAGARRRVEPGATAPTRTGTAVVACAAGEGLATLLAAAGAQVVPSAPRRRASAGQLLDAVRATGATHVLLLPNDGDTVLAADAAAQVAAEEGLTVRVVGQARAAVQGLAALAVWSPQAALDDNAAAMGAAAAATRRGSVTVAHRDAVTAAGPCRAGDVLGLVDGEVALVGADLPTVAIGVLTRLLADGGEVVTLVVGEQAPAGLSETVEAAARRLAPALEVTRLYGGQPLYPLFVGVE